MNRRALGVLASLAACAAGAAGAQPAYPSKPIRLVHGFLAGGNVDLNARLIAGPMGELLGQQVIVEGRPGAGGTVAAAQVAKAEPDGYTLFLAAAGHSASPALYRSLPYDPVRDFSFVTLVTSNPYLFVINPSFRAGGMAELVKLARARPGDIDYATGGIGTGMHLVALLVQSRLGLKMNHIAYKGGQATPSAVVGGEVPMMVGTPGEVGTLVDAGKLKVIGVSSAQRWRAWPQVPTLAETVLPGFDVRGWSALIGPARLPDAVVKRLNAAARYAMGRADVLEKFLAKGSDAAPTDPEPTRQFVAGEVERWGRTVKEAGIPPQN